MRPYTGIKEGIGKGKRPGTEAFIATIQTGTAGRLWNNGTYAMRPIRGGSTPSVHATGRAIDISFRRVPKHQGSSRAYAVPFIIELLERADELGLEMIIDYGYTVGLGGGRIWKCDRNSWREQKPGAIAGGGNPKSDWIHVELSPAAADSRELCTSVAASIVAELNKGVEEPNPNEPPKYPGRPLRLGSKGKAVEHIQGRLKIRVDGDFGIITERHVRDFQSAKGLEVDGVVGVNTWRELFQ